MIGLYVKFIPKKKSEIRLNILVYSLVPNRRIEGGGGGGDGNIRGLIFRYKKSIPYHTSILYPIPVTKYFSQNLVAGMGVGWK